MLGAYSATTGELFFGITSFIPRCALHRFVYLAAATNSDLQDLRSNLHGAVDHDGVEGRGSCPLLRGIKLRSFESVALQWRIDKTRAVADQEKKNILFCDA